MPGWHIQVEFPDNATIDFDACEQAILSEVISMRAELEPMVSDWMAADYARRGRSEAEIAERQRHCQGLVDALTFRAGEEPAWLCPSSCPDGGA
jgi:hypothetical protein